MHPRCGLAFLAFTVFVAFNLEFEELLTIDQSQDRGYGNVLRQQPAAQHFKGVYSLQANGTEDTKGNARVTMWSQQTASAALKMSTIVVTLLSSPASSTHTGLSGLNHTVGSVRDAEPGWLRRGQRYFQDVDIPLRGLELAAVNRVTAFGVSDPGKAFGPLPCRLDAVLTLNSGDGDGAEPKGGATAMLRGAAGNTSVGRKLGRPTAAHASGSDATTGILVEVVSLDCRLSIAVRAVPIDVQRISRKVIRYAVWANMLTAVQIRCFLAQMRYTEEGPSAGRLSIVGIAIQALTDGYDSFLHLSLSASSPYMYNYFAVVSLFKFVLFALLEVRYLLTIWRLRHRDVFAAGWDTVRRELSRVYSFFYGALIGGLVIIFNFLNYLDVIMMVLQAHWVPQIILDVRQGSKNALHPVFLMGISITRFLGVFYLWGCPFGVFNGDLYPQLPGAPSLRLCVAVLVLQGTQVGILASQRFLGPRWFIPWLCMPNVYNYSRSTELPSNSDCLICLAELLPEEASQRVITPCDHRFHRGCLEKWMDVKMECPACRTELPPMS